MGKQPWFGCSRSWYPFVCCHACTAVPIPRFNSCNFQLSNYCCCVTFWTQVELGSPPEQSSWPTPMPNQLKGDFEGVPNSYVVPAVFKVVDPRANYPEEQEVLYGVSSAIGNFQLDPENPGRSVTSHFDRAFPTEMVCRDCSEHLFCCLW